MQPILRVCATCALTANIACEQTPPPKRAAVAQTDQSTVPSSGSATCTSPSTGIRLDADTVAGLPTHASFAELRQRCPNASVDMVGVGGDVAPALRIEMQGAVLWAVQDTDGTLQPQRVPDFWAAQGDSLRYADGAALPLTAGALRRADSTALVFVDHGDDTGGSFIVRCRFPAISVVMGNSWPSLPDTGVVQLARISANDTTAAWRVEIDSRQKAMSSVRAGCAHVQPT